MTKEAVDQSQHDNALLFLKYEARLKENQELTNLELIFKGMECEQTLTITTDELQDTSANTKSFHNFSSDIKLLGELN